MIECPNCKEISLPDAGGECKECGVPTFFNLTEDDDMRTNEEVIEERLAELKDAQTDHELALDAITSEIEDLEYDLEMLNEEQYYQNEDEYRTDLGDLLVEIARTTGGEI